LRSSNETGIERGRVPVVFHDLLRLLDDTDDGRALLPMRFLVDNPEDLLQALNLLLGLYPVDLESRFGAVQPRRFCHLRKGYEDFLFGEVDVLEPFVK